MLMYHSYGASRGAWNCTVMRIDLLLKPGYAHWGVPSVDWGIALSDYCLPLCHFCTLHPSQHSNLVKMETSFSLHAQTHSHSWGAVAHTPGLCEANVRSPWRLCWVLDTLSSRWDADLCRAECRVRPACFSAFLGIGRRWASWSGVMATSTKRRV